MNGGSPQRGGNAARRTADGRSQCGGHSPPRNRERRLATHAKCHKQEAGTHDPHTTVGWLSKPPCKASEGMWRTRAHSQPAPAALPPMRIVSASVPPKINPLATQAWGRRRQQLHGSPGRRGYDCRPNAAGGAGGDLGWRFNGSRIRRGAWRRHPSPLRFVKTWKQRSRCEVCRHIFVRAPRAARPLLLTYQLPLARTDDKPQSAHASTA